MWGRVCKPRWRAHLRNETETPHRRRQRLLARTHTVWWTLWPTLLPLVLWTRCTLSTCCVRMTKHDDSNNTSNNTNNNTSGKSIHNSTSHSKLLPNMRHKMDLIVCVCAGVGVRCEGVCCCGVVDC